MPAAILMIIGRQALNDVRSRLTYDRRSTAKLTPASGLRRPVGSTA